MAERLRGVRVGVAAAVCVCLGACRSIGLKEDTSQVKTSEDVGSVYISAYPAVPWSAISDKLEPKFNMSVLDAQKLSTISTQSQVEQVLSTFAAGLAIGLPGRTTAMTTTIDKDGNRTTTGTKQLTPGTVPSSSGTNQVLLSDSNLATDLSKGPYANGVNGLTQIMNTVGIYQLAQVLDNQISKALPLDGYKAYLLTFQVNVQPARRGLAYDAVLDLVMMPASMRKAISASKDAAENADGLPPVMAYPLVIADAMESSNVGKSAETIRQAALALSGIVSNIGISAGIGGGKDHLESLTGSDLNTLVTVGRVSDHALQIRIGAAQQGSEKYALVPRTQNISVVVFVRTGDEPETHLDKLAVVTNTTFVLSKFPGGELPSRRATKEGREELLANVKNAVSRYGFALNPLCGEELDAAGDLLRELDRGNYDYLGRCLRAFKIEPTTVENSSRSPRQSMIPYSTWNTTLPAKVARDTNKQPIWQSLYQLSGAAEPGESTNMKQAQDKAPTLLTTTEEVRVRRVVAELMSLQADSRHSKLTIPLEPFKDKTMVFPTNQQMVFLSDAKAGASVVLRGGVNLDADKFRPILILKEKGSPTTKNLLPTKVEVDSTRRSATITYPSIAGNKLQPLELTKDASGKPTPIDFESIQLHLLTPKKPEGTKANLGQYDAAKPDAIYALKMLTSDEDPSPINPVSVTSNVVVADASGTAKVSVMVGTWEEKTALGLRVTGADVRAVEPSTAIDAQRKAVALSAKTVVTLTLANLSTTQPVKLQTIAGTSALGAPINLMVEPARQSGN